MLRRMCGFTLWQHVDVSALFDAGYLDVLLSVSPCIAIAVSDDALLSQCYGEHVALHDASDVYACWCARVLDCQFSICISKQLRISRPPTAASDTVIDMAQPAGLTGKTEPQRWTHAVAERLEQTRRTMPPWQGDLGKAGKSAHWEVRQAAARRQAARQPSRSGVWSGEVEEGGGTTSREPVARVTAVDVQQVMCHRTWGALLATDCEPQRHSLMVLGRPAQAA